ncbi:Bacterial FdrA protein [Escherichia coli]|nr:Bacterial FdrA protein [Escherichia coli]
MYTGGTLAAEAAGLLAGHLGVEADDTHHHGMMLDADGHQIIDLGDDFYTVGRPHPMIDPALRNQLIADLGAKPQVRVLLLDVVIGFGATADSCRLAGKRLAKSLCRAFRQSTTVCHCHGDRH